MTRGEFGEFFLGQAAGGAEAADAVAELFEQLFVDGMRHYRECGPGCRLSVKGYTHCMQRSTDNE